ncbi:carbohydrate ABC transporter permease [Paenibacillus glycanilyticus]|uniref:Sugar ABC transporter permease n=1 Tax=Paenibacillus glycanilyticus TaxID=126569 RepID=A0ABQ6G969_9BACL|nr:carbohydrate ABC transporter permease [Paenibacillus glycanilyticus]GLX67504.1 sugar ABC transporter permease [Paenibacillus glycanilyticus]
MRQSLAERSFNGFIYLFLILLCVVTVYPFLYVLLYSFSDATAASATQITLYPVKATLENYTAVFANKNIFHSFFVSASRTVIGAISHVLVTSLAAYSLSKAHLIARKKLLVYFLIPMYFSGGLLPFYVLIINLHLNNNFLVYILPALFGTYNMLLFKTYFEHLPQTIEEAAKIDGAGDFTIFTRIVIPSSMPIIATVLLFSGVGQWNAYFDAILFVTKENLMPLQTLLYRIVVEQQADTMEKIMKLANKKSNVTPESIKMATIVVSIVPILIVYPFLQRFYIKGAMLGAVKS